MEMVFRRFAGPVHAYLRGAGAADSENMLGDVMVDVLRGLDKFRGDDAALRRWVFTIAHHRIVDERRRRARWRPAVTRSRAQTEHALPPGEPVDPQLVAALQDLTADQREVVLLRFVADLPLEDVARMTGRTAGAVKSLQHRALANLANALLRPT
jgi:RNA polymerase sigma factor (sigma-70 family)